MPLVTRTANQGNVFKQATEPTDWQDGDLWIDTSVNPPAVNVNDNGTATEVGQLNQDSTIDFNGTIIDIEALF